MELDDAEALCMPPDGFAACEMRFEVFQEWAVIVWNGVSFVLFKIRFGIFLEKASFVRPSPREADVR